VIAFGTGEIVDQATLQTANSTDADLLTATRQNQTIRLAKWAEMPRVSAQAHIRDSASLRALGGARYDGLDSTGSE
jgi:hypothetical protein